MSRFWIMLGMLLISQIVWGDPFDYTGAAGDVVGEWHLPPGWGPLLLNLFRLIGIVVIMKGVVVQYDIGRQNNMMGNQPSARTVIAHYFVGTLIYHMDKTVAMVAASLPFLPSMGNIFTDAT